MTAPPPPVPAGQHLPGAPSPHGGHWEPPALTGPIGRSWLVLLLAGGALLVAAGVLAAVALAGAFGGPVLHGAGSVSEHVHAGSYLLYAEDGTSEGAGGFSVTQSETPRVDADAVSVTVDGAPVAVTAYDKSYSSTLTRGDTHYLAIAEIHVPHAGELVLTARSDQGPLVIAPSISGTLRKVVLPAVVGLVGVVLAVVGIVRRVRAGSRRKPRWVMGT